MNAISLFQIFHIIFLIVYYKYIYLINAHTQTK